MGADNARLRAELHAYGELRKRWAADPVAYAVERLGMNPTWQQRAIFEAIAPEGAKVSARAGHGVGKSGATSGIGLWFLETRDFAKIPCTAPTSAQLRDVLWAELGKWARKADDLSRKRGDHPRFWLTNLFNFTKDRIYDIGAPAEWFATARTSSKENPDALQGFHASDVRISADGTGVENEGDELGKILFIIDEASGVFEGVFEVAEGALSSHGARLLMLGNPTRTSGYFYRSHHADRGEFTALHFKSGDSPLVDPKYRERLVRKYGEGSNIVRVRADGEFPKQDDDVLISIEDCEPCIDREAYGDSRFDIRVGADVARFGNDRLVICVRQGRDLLHLEVHAKQSTMAAAGMIANVAATYGAHKIFVDGVGLGAGVVDRLAELRSQGRIRARVLDVVVSKVAPPRFDPMSMEPLVEAQGYRLRDHLWLEGAQWLRDEAPSFGLLDRDHAEDLAGELASTKYKHDSSGRIVVESKEEMKKRLGHSPDLADSILLTFAPDDLSHEAMAPESIDRESPWDMDYDD